MKTNEIITLSIATVILVLGLLALSKYHILDWTKPMDTAQAIQIILTFVLVLITAIYVKRTADIATANASMAEEMRNAISPSITMQWMSADPNQRRISDTLKNEGFGTALNLKCYLTHKKFSFSHKFEGYTTFEVGQKYLLSLPSENFDFETWNGLAINCDYESVLGREKFSSTLMVESKEKRSLEINKLNNGDKND